MIALLAAARAIHFVGLMAIFGASTYGLLLRRAGLPEPPVRPERVLFVIASTLALTSAIVWFCLIAGQMSGDWRGSIDPGTLQLAASATRFGQIFVARFIGLATLWFMCAFRTKPHALVVPIFAGLLLISLGPVSHAAAAPGDVALFGAANDAAHLLTSGFWLGGLMVLAILVPRYRAGPAALLGPLRLFSTWGGVAVALLVITGLINAASILPVSARSFHNAYFGLLLVKIGLASLMIGIAILNRWRFAPALENGGPGAVRHLTGSIGIEITLGITVVGIAGYLGLTTPH